MSQKRKRRLFTDNKKQRIKKRDGYHCLRCGSPYQLTIDHIVPLAKGGHPTDDDNLQTLCSRCNGQKADQSVDYRSENKKWDAMLVPVEGAV